MYKVRFTTRVATEKGKNIIPFIKSVTVEDLERLLPTARPIFETISKNKPLLGEFYTKKYHTIELQIEEGYWFYKNFGDRSKIYAFFLALWLANNV